MIIAGAGSAGKETLAVLWTLKEIAKDIVFYDEGNMAPEKIWDIYTVIKSEAAIKEYLKVHPNFSVAIGNTRLRERMYNKLLTWGGKPLNIIAQNAFTINLQESEGLIIQPCVTMSYDVSLGRSCMVHANAVIGHRVNIGEFVNISPLVSIVGPCTIGPHCFIGSGSIILPHLTIGKHVLIPAGSIVNRNLNDYETFENS